MRLFGFEFRRAPLTRQTAVAGTADTPENEGKWRAIRDGRRSLPGFQCDRSLDIAAKLLREDGIACRMAEWLDEWTVGDGCSLTSNLKDEPEREAHEAFLYQLWDAPECRWETLQHDIPKTLRPMGELLFTLHPPKARPGVTVLAHVDAGEISQVFLNPKNSLQTVGVALKAAPGMPAFFLPHHAWVRWAKENPKLAGRSGFPEIPPEGGTFRLERADGVTTYTVGSLCAYFPFNRLLGTSRGASWYYPIADLLDAFDQSVWQQMEGVGARNTLAGIVIGGTRSDKSGNAVVDALQANMGKGGVFIGAPEGTDLKTLGGGLGSGEYDTHHGTLCKRLSAATCFPITWFGMGSDTGNAATTELASPAMKMLRKAQGEVREVFREIFDFAIREGAPLDKVETWLDYGLTLPEVGGRDMVRDATAFGGLSVAISDGTTEGAWTQEKAGQMRRDLASQFLGVEFDPDDYPDAAALEAEKQAPTAAPGTEDPDPAAARKEAAEMEEMKERGKKARQSRRRRAPVTV